MGDKTAARTPAKTPSTAKKQGQAPSTGKQQSILGFFSKTPASSANAPNSSPSVKPTPSLKKASSSQCLQETTKSNSARRPPDATPVPSSDAPEPTSSQENRDVSTAKACVFLFSYALSHFVLLTLCPTGVEIEYDHEGHHDAA